MKETGMIFIRESVRAILDGRKTQTRRVIKPCSTATVADGSQPEWVYTTTKCPYGKAGDRLWVRETWKTNTDDWGRHKIEYKAGGEQLGIPEPIWRKYHHYLNWQPSMFMFKSISRLTLELTADPYPQRLQEISEEDAIAEGCSLMAGLTKGGSIGLASARYVFMKLWDSINGKKHPWDSNDWVWVNTFRRLE